MYINMLEVLWAFDIIENFLVWNIRNGVVVRLGVDPWVGCKWRHILPPYVIEKLHLVGIFSLKDTRGLHLVKQCHSTFIHGI